MLVITARFVIKKETLDSPYSCQLFSRFLANDQNLCPFPPLQVKNAYNAINLIFQICVRNEIEVHGFNIERQGDIC